MAYQTENTIDKREARVAAALAFKEGDRVPFAPRVSSPYAQTAGISMHEAWNDFRMMVVQGVIIVCETSCQRTRRRLDAKAFRAPFRMDAVSSFEAPCSPL